MIMKLFHISDLHIGKQLHGYSLLEDQKKILHEIVRETALYHPNALLIAGDIFDKSVPSGEAYDVFDQFLRELAEIEPVVPVCIIAGNHDSAQRLNYASGFLEKHHIYISSMPPQSEEEHLCKVTLSDAQGPVNIYLLPFTKPSYVRKLFPGQEVSDYDTAVRLLLEREAIDFSERNVLVAHQFFVSGDSVPLRSDSELTTVSVGGIDSVSVDCVMGFDYVALGHIHSEQAIGDNKICYSGTPLKYSVSEEKQEKGITMVMIGKKGTNVSVQRIPLEQPRDVRSIRGTLQEVIAAATEENCHDYVSIVLTDKSGLYRPKEQLEESYDHILEVRMENAEVGEFDDSVEGDTDMADPLKVFDDFFETMNERKMDSEEAEIMRQIISDMTDCE